MNELRKLLKAFFLVLIVLFIGTFGYIIIEGWSFLDSLYMTVITTTTVGFGEIRQVGALGRFFTIFIIFMGVGVVAYTGGAVVEIMLIGRIKKLIGRKMIDTKISKLKDHYIICGYGRIGQIIYEGIKEKNKKYSYY